MSAKDLNVKKDELPQKQREGIEEQEENVRQGRGNIVTDSSGRPVTSRSTGRAVTTSRGRELRESGAAGDAAIERQADALRKDAHDRERAEASRRSEQRVQKKLHQVLTPKLLHLKVAAMMNLVAEHIVAPHRGSATR